MQKVITLFLIGYGAINIGYGAININIGDTVVLLMMIYLLMCFLND